MLISGEPGNYGTEPNRRPSEHMQQAQIQLTRLLSAILKILYNLHQLPFHTLDNLHTHPAIPKYPIHLLHPSTAASSTCYSNSITISYVQSIASTCVDSQRLKWIWQKNPQRLRNPQPKPTVVAIPTTTSNHDYSNYSQLDFSILTTACTLQNLTSIP